MDLTDFSPTVTMSVFLGMILLGVVPKVPLAMKLGVQVLVGAIIYIKLSDSAFNLPFGDSLVISALTGGSGGLDNFNNKSMGFLAPLVGILFSLLSALIGKVSRKK